MYYPGFCACRKVATRSKLFWSASVVEARITAFENQFLGWGVFL